MIKNLTVGSERGNHVLFFGPVKVKRVPKLPENDESKYIKTLAKMQGTSSHGCTKYCLDRFAGSSSLFHIPEWPR